MFKILLATVATVALASSAEATVNVSIWTGQPGAGANATISAASGLGTPTATTTVSAINFDSRVSGYTVGAFLNNPAGLSSGVATADLNNVYMLFTGQISLNAGANVFSIAHDDGLQLAIDGISGFVVNQPGPTAPTTTTFTANAPTTGVYNFTLAYGEVMGPPAVLTWNFNGAPVTGSVPEPATWALMLIGFGGIGLAMRRLRRGAAFEQLA